MAAHEKWMPLYVGDYLADTMHLTTRQHGAYLLLILSAWRNGGEIPERSLMAVSKLTAKEWREDGPVLAEFFEVGSLWEHKRVKAELGVAKAVTDQRSRAGKASAAKRERERQQNANENPTPVEHPLPPRTIPSPSPSPLPSPSVTTISTVADSAPARATHTGWSAPIPDDWTPSEPALQRLRVGRPDLIGEFYDSRLQAFRLWCREKAITSHDFEATWMKFMIQSHAAAAPRSPFKPTMQTMPETRPEDWAWRVEWHRDKGMWNPSWGPEPGQPGCFVPKDLLQ